MFLSTQKKKSQQLSSSRVKGWNRCTQPIVRPPPLTQSSNSVLAGKFSTWGKGSFTRVIKGVKCGGIFGRQSMFLGVDMNEMWWPFRAISFPSSKYGIMWPKANHGNMAMWSFLDWTMEVSDWWCWWLTFEFIFTYIINFKGL